EEAMGTLREKLPKAQVYVASIPDLKRLAIVVFARLRRAVRGLRHPRPPGGGRRRFPVSGARVRGGA
ncbi:hypothetical protein ACWCQJ_32390, partial [Streptomyces olivaceus]